MKEVFGDIWELAPKYDIIVITTNGYVKTNGEAVMGRGIAKEAKERYPTLPAELGKHISRWGNTIGWFYGYDKPIISFPVKPSIGPNGEPGWKAKADLKLIEESAKRLEFTVTFNVLDGPPRIILPRPGCGNGGLKWEDVRPVIEPILDDRFTVVTWHP